MNGYSAVITGICGMIFFSGGFFSPAWLAVPKFNRIAYSTGMLLFFGTVLAELFENASTASSAVLFCWLGASLGALGCARILIASSFDDARVKKPGTHF